MSEIVLSVTEVDDQHLNHREYTRYSGYAIKTSTRLIKILIDLETSCCESPGYFCSEDNFEDFISAEVLDVKVVDTALKVYEITDFEEGGVMFVNLETSKGTLQFAAYNQQNGYYGHNAILMIDDNVVHSEGV